MKIPIIKFTLSFLEVIMFFIVFITINPVLVLAPLIFYIYTLYICLKNNIAIVNIKKSLMNQITDLLGWPAIFFLFYILSKNYNDLTIAFVFSGIAVIKSIYLTAIYLINKRKTNFSECK